MESGRKKATFSVDSTKSLTPKNKDAERETLKLPCPIQ